MSICPKCNHEINYLVNFSSGENRWEFDGDDYAESEFFSDGQVNDFECPECKETLFTEEEKAKEFLKGVEVAVGEMKQV